MFSEQARSRPSRRACRVTRYVRVVSLGPGADARYRLEARADARVGADHTNIVRSRLSSIELRARGERSDRPYECNRTYREACAAEASSSSAAAALVLCSATQCDAFSRDAPAQSLRFINIACTAKGAALSVLGLSQRPTRRWKALRESRAAGRSATEHCVAQASKCEPAVWHCASLAILHPDILQCLLAPHHLSQMKHCIPM